MVIIHNLIVTGNKVVANTFELYQHAAGTNIRKYRFDGILFLEIKYNLVVPLMLITQQEIKLL